MSNLQARLLVKCKDLVWGRGGIAAIATGLKGRKFCFRVSLYKSNGPKKLELDIWIMEYLSSVPVLR
jgi:hypothetical protein